jgi:hypothetical protein
MTRTMKTQTIKVWHGNNGAMTIMRIIKFNSHGMAMQIREMGIVKKLQWY